MKEPEDKIEFEFPKRCAGVAFGILAPVLRLSPEARQKLSTDEGLEEVIEEATSEYFEERAKYLQELP